MYTTAWKTSFVIKRMLGSVEEVFSHLRQSSNPVGGLTWMREQKYIHISELYTQSKNRCCLDSAQPELSVHFYQNKKERYAFSLHFKKAILQKVCVDIQIQIHLSRSIYFEIRCGSRANSHVGLGILGIISVRVGYLEYFGLDIFGSLSVRIINLVWCRGLSSFFRI